MEKIIKRLNMTESEAKEFYKDKTLSELLNIFKINENSFRSTCNYHCISWKRSYTKKKKRLFPRDDMIRALSKDFSYENIGIAFGISRQRVEQIVRGE